MKPQMQNKETPVVLLHSFDRCSKYAIDKISLHIFYAHFVPEFHAFLFFSAHVWNGDMHIHCWKNMVLRPGPLTPLVGVSLI